MIRRPALIALLPTALAVSFAACTKPIAAPVPRVQRVLVAPVAPTAGARELHLSGTLSAERAFPLGFATMGTVEQVLVEEGQMVEPGQLLARLSPRSYQDALGIAEAKAKQAEDAYRRLLPMHQNRTLPDVKFVEVETGRDQARLAVSLAQRNLADTELRSPIRGVVSNRGAEPGMTVAPGLPAFTLVQTGTLTAVAPVPEMQIASVRRKAAARITVPALGKEYSGQVREIAVAANPLTRTYDVKVAVPNPRGDLRVGMIADIHLQVGDGTGTGARLLAVPPEAVRVDEKGATYVFVVASGDRLEKRPVAVARFVGESTAVEAGLREGELVVTSGSPMLYDGLAVRVSNQAAGQVAR